VLGKIRNLWHRKCKPTTPVATNQGILIPVFIPAAGCQVSVYAQVSDVSALSAAPLMAAMFPPGIQFSERMVRP
jgi:hypothetical protein